MTGVLLIAASLSAAQAFWSRDLAGVRQAIDAELSRPRSTHTGAVHLWSEVEALMACLPPGLEQRRPFVPRTPWELLVGLVRLERLRLVRTGVEASSLGQVLGRADFFSRESAAPDALIHWPSSDEVWSDERVLPIVRPSECEAATPASDVAAARADELALAQALLSVTPPDHPAFVSLVLHCVALLVDAGEVASALVIGARLVEAPMGHASAEEQVSARLVRALAREAMGEDEELIEEWQALETQAGGGVEAFVALRLESALARAGRWAALRARLESKPITPDAAGWYRAYLRGRALSASGDTPGLLAHAREVLRDAPESAAQNSSLSALADLVWATLSESPFDERVVELIEGFGSPRLVYARIERFAVVALARGRTTVAGDAWSWLLAHHQNGQAHARYRAGLVDVAFDAANLAQFRAQLRALTRPDERLLEAIPSARRGAFFDERDQALLALASRTVPRLGERGDDAWTRAFVDVLQTFLRDAPESRAHATLTSLYRTARGLLSSGARAYAERVGAERPTLVLGEVKVDRALPEPPAPTVPWRIEEPRYLLRLPTTDALSPLRAWFEEPP